jgi:hypothetical protein
MSDSIGTTKDYADEEAFCRKHGSNVVVKTGTFSGYAGDVCYYWKLVCGCTLIGESDDILAAE